ncbi:hypothetical protein CGL56_04530 [Neolewinella marina]|uniref:Uncharacterized protein n=2 Tax=Neolewinella marina TaxID=438751 RepID=A0A2G0CK09_9BACT|nr:hypothetical protein CGL56_04530 [Neolewinella marina]
MVAQQSASVLPYVNTNKQFELRSDTAVRVALSVVNSGVGPALVSEMRLTLDDRPVRADSLAAAIRERYPEVAATQVRSNTMEAGVLPVDADVVLATLEFDLRRAGFAAVSGVMDRVRVDICYCNVYGSCWKYREEGWNEATDDCPAPMQIQGD